VFRDRGVHGSGIIDKSIDKSVDESDSEEGFPPNKVP